MTGPWWLPCLEDRADDLFSHQGGADKEGDILVKKFLPMTIVICLLLAMGEVYAKPPGNEAPNGAVDGTFYAEVSGVWNSNLWTVPGEKNPAGSVNFGGTAYLDMGVLEAEFGADADTCFGDVMGRGMQIYDANFSGNDAGVIARAWFKAYTKSGKLVQYVISFSTSTLLPWLQKNEEGGVGTFHPALGDTIYRSADSWSMGAAKSAKDACRTDGDVPPLVGSGTVLEIYLSQVEACQYPDDEVLCN